MSTFPRVSPRRLTGGEEAELLEAARRLEDADANAERMLKARDRLIADVVQAGARVTDVADVLKLTRNAVYDALKRAEAD